VYGLLIAATRLIAAAPCAAAARRLGPGTG
jgi:hypothetical protein